MILRLIFTYSPFSPSTMIKTNQPTNLRFSFHAMLAVSVLAVFVISLHLR